MKKLFLLGALFSVVSARSQNVAACNAAQNICSNPNFTFQGISGTGLPSTLNISNPTTNPQTGNGSNPSGPANSGCLLTNGPGPQWLILTVSVSGNLGFIFGDPSSANPQAGFYDWAMWPYMPSTCTNIFNNTLPPVSCNWNASSSGGTGMGTVPGSGNVGNYQPSIPVTAGQQFLILISNYSGVNTLVSFTSTGTASLTCGFNYSICAGGSATVTPVGFTPLTSQTFTLQPGNVINTTGTFVVTPTISTTYTVYGSGLNTQSVLTTQNSTTSIVVNPQPSAAPTATQSTCTQDTSRFNLHLSFYPAASNPTYNITWAPVPAGIPNNTTSVWSGVLSPGNYNATVTAAGGCTATASFSIAAKPEAANLVLSPPGNVYSVTCYQPTVTINAIEPTYSYTWTNGLIAPQNGTTASFNFTGGGTWTVTAVNPVSGCVATKTFIVGQNTVAPSSQINPSFTLITCNQTMIPTVTLTSLNPTVNVTHVVLSCLGGSFTANNISALYQPGTPCTYTHVLINNINGCSATKQFTVSASQGFPTFSLSSAPSGYTLGCNSKSVITISINNGDTDPPGGAVSYSLLFPGNPGVTPPGPLGGISSFSNVNVPGTYTVITKDNVSFCESRVPITVISNTFGPSIDTMLIPRNVLDCYVNKTLLKGISSTPNVAYNWSWPGTPGNLPTDSITVVANFTSRTTTLVNNYTLTITDNNNTCITRTTVPVYQNLFPPNAVISNGGVSALTCQTPTVMLTNMSTTGIQGNFFPKSNKVVGYLWEGPTPELPLQVSTNYLGSTVGVYTMTAMDLNNGCTSTATINIADNKIFPVLAKPAPEAFVLDCGTGVATLSLAIVSATNNLTYHWIVPADAKTTPTDKPTLTTDQPGSYRVVITNSANACGVNTDLKVTMGTLTAAFQPDASHGYAPFTVNFNNQSSSSLGSASVTSVWVLGNGSSSITPSATVPVRATYNQPGTYTVVMYSSKGACLDSTSRIVQVDIPSSLTVPNVFTPNNDGVNDVFFLKTSNLEDVSMSIYDRWGHLVYEVHSGTGNVEWDGRNQAGKEVAEGTFYYYLKAKGRDGQSYDSKGTISLFR